MQQITDPNPKIHDRDPDTALTRFADPGVLVWSGSGLNIKV